MLTENFIIICYLLPNSDSLLPGRKEIALKKIKVKKMYAEISAAIASAKTALNIAKSAHDLSSYNELITAISEVNTKLMDATTVALSSQEKQSALSNRIADLEDKLRDVENWESQIKRYALHEFPETKTFAYKLKHGINDDESLHYLCATCVSKSEKSIMQPAGHTLYCPVCKTNIHIQEQPPRKKRTVRSASPYTKERMW